jgi:hypothetical protein
MDRYIISIISLIMFGCTTTKFVEKQSEELSKAVYATKDSLECARFDLLEMYSDESARLVPPPKDRIKIESIIKNNSNNGTERVLILSSKNKNDKIVITDSSEYQELVKDKRVNDQLKLDVQNWTLYSKEVDMRLTEQYKIQNEMIVRIQDLEKQVLEKDKLILRKDLAILWRNITVVSLLSVIGVCTYLRIKGIL